MSRGVAFKSLTFSSLKKLMVELFGFMSRWIWVAEIYGKKHFVTNKQFIHGKKASPK